MTYTPDSNCFFGEVSRMFSPYSLLCSKGTKKGIALGLPACCVPTAGILSARPNVHSGTQTAPKVTACNSGPKSRLHPTTTRAQPTHTQDNYNLSAPLAFSNIRSGKHFSVSTCYFPPDVPATTMSTVLGSRDFSQKCALGNESITQPHRDLQKETSPPSGPSRYHHITRLCSILDPDAKSN